eukprot:scaffold143125_cov81-Phaeocystis_antarctica.AAC.1
MVAAATGRAVVGSACHWYRNPPATMRASAAARCDTRHASGHGRRCEEGDGRQRASRRTPRARHGACNHAALR